MKTVKRLLMLALVLAPAQTWAGDPEAGKKKSFVCVSCHGNNGIGVGPLWPNLAGQKTGYLIKQMKDFRSGKRVGPMMGPLMKGLSDEDIADLAAYYNHLGNE
ncbi:MAG: cytochrome c [Gammaproteobacteria bacterium]